MAVFATLADVKLHLNKTSAVDDAELQGMLDAATELVESYVGTFTQESVSERVEVRGGTVLLGYRPVVGDVTLTDATGGVVTGYTVNHAAGVVYDVVAYGPLIATYTAGDSVVPASVTLATAIITAHLWETQRGTAPTPLALQQDVDVPFPGGVGFAIPNRAKELLEPYIRRAQVA